MIRIEIDDRDVIQALQRLQRRVGDLTPAMREIGEVGIGYSAVFEVLPRRRMLALKTLWKTGRPPVIRP